MPTAEEIRTDFVLDPDVAFLNHGSFGAVPRPVLDRQAELRAKLERAPVAFLARELRAALDAVRKRLKHELGVEDPARLVLTANATTAVNAAALSLPLAKGDEVLMTDVEYGAMRLVWDEVAGRNGATTVVAELPRPAVSAETICEAIWSRVTGRTRVLFLSHITSETALVLPVRELCRRARSDGILRVVDGAHGPGQLDLRLDDLGADCYTGNGHKWLCAHKGCAFLYVRDDLHGRLAPPVVSWGWRSDGDGAFQDRFSWPGTDDPTAILSLPAALDYLGSIDWRIGPRACMPSRTGDAGGRARLPRRRADRSAGDAGAGDDRVPDPGRGRRIRGSEAAGRADRDTGPPRRRPDARPAVGCAVHDGRGLRAPRRRSLERLTADARDRPQKRQIPLIRRSAGLGERESRIHRPPCQGGSDPFR